MSNDKVLYEIKEHIGVISTYETGWCKELNLIAWNGQAPKYDVRDWNPEHDRMSRGVTLYEGEMHRLVNSFIGHNNRRVVEQAKQEEAERKSRNSNFKKSQFKQHSQEMPTEEPMDEPMDEHMAEEVSGSVENLWETQVDVDSHTDEVNALDGEAVCENTI